jgi:hypothetical protein
MFRNHSASDQVHSPVQMLLTFFFMRKLNVFNCASLFCLAVFRFCQLLCNYHYYCVIAIFRFYFASKQRIRNNKLMQSHTIEHKGFTLETQTGKPTSKRRFAQ